MNASYQIVFIQNSRLFAPLDFLPAGAEIVITASPYGCLLLCRRETWEPMEEKMLGLPRDDNMLGVLTRLVVGNATSETIDSDGAFLVPPELLEFAHLGTIAYWEPTESCVKIWNPVAFTEKSRIKQPE